MSGLPPVVRDDAAGRFEATVDGHLAELTFRRVDDRLILIHTGVPEEIGGRGIAGALAASAIAYAARDGLTVVPQCPYVRHWLERHPDAAASVTIAPVT